MKKFLVVTALLAVVSTIVLQSISLAWMSDNGLSSPIDITTNVHKAYFASGDGLKDVEMDGDEVVHGPFEIATPLQLYYFAWLQYLGFFNNVDNNEDGEPDTVYFRLSADLDMDYTNEDGVRTQFVLPPIGTTDMPFIGNFDGEGHTITDLTVENKYSSLIEPPDGTENFKGAEIIGFFGVIGALPGSDYKYDTQAIEVKNVVLENLTIKTQTDYALIGLVAGYVNGIVDRVGVVNSQVDIKAGTQSLSYTENMSDYSLIGYCDPAYRDKVYMLNLSLNTPGISDKYNVIPDMTGDGDQKGWGGSVKMLDIFNLFTEISTTVNDDYSIERVDVKNLNGVTVTLSRDPADEDPRTATLPEFGSFIFTTMSGNFNGNMTVNFVGGAQHVTQYEYILDENSSVPLYFITDDTYYLCYNNGVISSTTDSTQATAWYISNGTSGGNIYTVVDGEIHYLTIEDGAIDAMPVDPRSLPSWSVSGNSYALNGQQITCDNGTWKLADTFKIAHGNNYLVNNGTNLGAGDSSTNVVWTLTKVDGGYHVSTVVRNNNNTTTTYYLMYTTSNSNYGQTTVSGPTLSNTTTSPSVWQYDGTRLYAQVTRYGWVTNYYLRYNNNSWQLNNSNNNNNLTFTSSSNANVDVNTSGTTAGKITLEETEFIDNDRENVYYDENGDRQVTGAGITYIPLTFDEEDGLKASLNNSGYIIGAQWGSLEKSEYDADGNIRISEYGQNRLGSKGAPYTMTYLTEGGFNQITSRDKSALEKLGLKKFAECYDDYIDSVATHCHGLHFMQASVTKDNVTTITARLNGRDIENYQVPTNCIDFNLYEAGLINFVAGSYYTQPTVNDSFFSIYEIIREPDDETKIKEIKEIRKIYAHVIKDDNGVDQIDTSKPYYYTYREGNAEVGTENIPANYREVFDCHWITNPDSYTGWARDTAYYFEVPVNAGEYAIGSTEGRIGAYLVYLDLAANAQLIERVQEYEEITENSTTADLPHGVEMLAPSQDGYDTTDIDSKNSAFASINGGTSGTITFDKEGNMILHSATSGTTAEYINTESKLLDGNGNPMTIPSWTVTKIYERTTYRDLNINTGVSTVTVITKIRRIEGGNEDVKYTKKVTITDAEGNVTETESESTTELFPETKDKEGDPDVTAGGKLIDIALGYGKENSLLVSYEFVPGSVDENGATVAPKYIITFKNTGAETVKIKAILTELGTTSGIDFIVTDGTTETTLGKTTDEQFVEIAVSAAPADPEAPEEETPEEPEPPEQA